MSKQEYELRYEKQVRAQGMAIEWLERESVQNDESGNGLTEVRFKLDADNGTSVLCILKRDMDSRQEVAFVGGLTVGTCLLAVAKKLRGESLRWREDRPWGAS